MNSASTQVRPRMLFFRWTKPNLPAFLEQHLSEQVRALAHFFEIRLIDFDCDYAQQCDEFEPDIAVFESGVYAGKRSISNTNARPDIPKLGFLHADAYDMARATFLSDMERWGVEHFFTTSVVMADYTPEIADRMFVWPNSIDPEIYRDYGLAKNIPVLLTGSQERHYPWRNAVSQVVSRQYPTMTMPHFGWGNGASRTKFGSDYARLINASIFVPACGSMAHEVVRKHLEVPGSGACLITERTSALEAFGFEDMVNCVFADAGSIIDKMDLLTGDPFRLEEITKNGYDLVHSRHTQQSRNQVLQWLQLTRSLRPGERIIQENPSGSLTLMPSDTIAPVISSGGLDRNRIAAGWAAYSAGKFADSEREFLKCLNYYFIPEAVVGLIFSALREGRTEVARDWSTRALDAKFSDRGASDPDPVLWACHLRGLLCSDEIDQAVKAAHTFPELHHPELERVRSFVALLQRGTDTRSEQTSDIEIRQAVSRASVCPIPFVSEKTWTQELASMLVACGQSKLAEILTSAEGNMLSVNHMTAGPESVTSGSKRPLTGRMKFVVPRMHRRLRWALRTGVARQLRVKFSPLKQRYVTDTWADQIRQLIRCYGFERLVVVGSVERGKDLRALKAGVSQNPSLPTLEMVIAESTAISLALKRGDLMSRTVVYVGTDAASALDSRLIAQCQLVIMDGTAGRHGFNLLSSLTAEEGFRLVSQELNLNKGCAILERESSLAPQMRPTSGIERAN